MSASTGTYLNAETIAAMRAFDEGAMRDTCEIHRTVPGGTNPDNSPGDGTVQIQTGIKCRFTKVSRLIRGTEGLFALGFSGDYAAFLRVPVGTDVTADDIIVFNGDQYEIVGTNEGRTFATSLALALSLLT